MTFFGILTCSLKDQSFDYEAINIPKYIQSFFNWNVYLFSLLNKSSTNRFNGALFRQNPFSTILLVLRLF